MDAAFQLFSLLPFLIGFVVGQPSTSSPCDHVFVSPNGNCSCTVLLFFFGVYLIQLHHSWNRVLSKRFGNCFVDQCDNDKDALWTLSSSHCANSRGCVFGRLSLSLSFQSVSANTTFLLSDTTCKGGYSSDEALPWKKIFGNPDKSTVLSIAPTRSSVQLLNATVEHSIGELSH